MNIVPTATDRPRSSRAMATAIHEPMPGRVTVVCPTVIDSAATTKNQPPDIDIIMFHTGRSANGTSRRQKRIHGDRRK